MNNTILSGMIRRYRMMHELSVRDLATVVGVSHGTLQRIEHGEMCDVMTLHKLVLWLASPDGPVVK